MISEILEGGPFSAQQDPNAKRLRRVDSVGTVTFEWKDGPASHVVAVKLSSTMIGHLIKKAHEFHKCDVEDRVQAVTA